MKRTLFFAGTLLGTAFASMAQAAGAPPLRFDPTQIQIEGELGPFKASWEVTELEAHVKLATLTLKAPEPATIPPFDIKWNVPAVDIAGVWVSDTGASKFDHERARIESRAVQRAPLMTYLNQGDTNRMTMALSDAMLPSLLRGGIREEDCRLYMTLSLFKNPVPPVKHYTLTLRFDSRAISYEEAIRDTVRWWAAQDNYTPTPVPDAARLPLYSTWYSYHQHLDPDQIVEECRIGGQIGLQGVIVDDGWQTLDGNRGYAFTGDWKPERIPDMKGFVDRVHALDQKFLLWYSVPMVGEKSEAIKRFRNMTLSHSGALQAYVLDPRYPEVREYLIGIFEAAVRDWGIDGLKLDFIGMFSSKTNTPQTAENGRDYASVDEAVDRLMSDIMKRLRKMNPDIAIEFRQPYNGPLMRKYGNMFRAVDCPNCAPVNRNHIADLRLIADTTAVHSDMIMWHPEEPVESAALQVLNILFSVPQISVRLADVSAGHREMLKFWMNYWTRNRETLLDGEFRAYAPAQNYPMLVGRTEKKLIAALYQDMIVAPGATVPGQIDVVNAKKTPHVVVRLDKAIGPCAILVFDARGKLVSKDSKTLDAGAHAWDVPPSGLLQITRTQKP